MQPRARPGTGSPGWVGFSGVGGPASVPPTAAREQGVSRAPKCGRDAIAGSGCETGGQAGERDAITESGCSPGRARGRVRRDGWASPAWAVPPQFPPQPHANRASRAPRRAGETPSPGAAARPAGRPGSEPPTPRGDAAPGAPGAGFAGMGGRLRRGRSRISSPHSRTRTGRLARPEVRARRHRRERLRDRRAGRGARRHHRERLQARARPGWVRRDGWASPAWGGPASCAPQPHANRASRAPRRAGETPSPGAAARPAGWPGSETPPPRADAAPGAPGDGFAGMGGLLRRGRSRISSPHSRTRTWRLARPDVRARRHRRERLRARAARPGAETPTPGAAAGPGAPGVGSPGWGGIAGVGGPASGAPQPHANMASRAPRSEGETPSPGAAAGPGGQAGERDAIAESGCRPGRALGGFAGMGGPRRRGRPGIRRPTAAREHGVSRAPKGGRDAIAGRGCGPGRTGRGARRHRRERLQARARPGWVRRDGGASPAWAARHQAPPRRTRTWRLARPEVRARRHPGERLRAGRAGRGARRHHRERLRAGRAGRGARRHHRERLRAGRAGRGARRHHRERLRARTGGRGLDGRARAGRADAGGAGGWLAGGRGRARKCTRPRARMSGRGALPLLASQASRLLSPAGVSAQPAAQPSGAAHSESVPASSSLEIADESTGMPGPVVVEMVTFCR